MSVSRPTIPAGLPSLFHGTARYRRLLEFAKPSVREKKEGEEGHIARADRGFFPTLAVTQRARALALGWAGVHFTEGDQDRWRRYQIASHLLASSDDE